MFDKVENVKNIICKNLKYLRNNKRLSIEYVAGLLDVSRWAYSYYENNKRDISISQLLILAKFYDVSLDTIASENMVTSLNTATKFTYIECLNGKYEYLDRNLEITNPNFDLIVVKVDDSTTKIFEAHDTIVNGSEYLFEYMGEILISTINVLSDGSFFLFNSYNQPIRVEKRARNKIIIIGELQSTINKKYNKENFF